LEFRGEGRYGKEGKLDYGLAKEQCFQFGVKELWNGAREIMRCEKLARGEF